MPRSATTFTLFCAVPAVGFLTFASTSTHAADLAARPVAAPIVPIAAGMAFSSEVFGGYLTGLAGEYVYRVPGDQSKLSQLN
jgi:plasminogen activator